MAVENVPENAPRCAAKPRATSNAGSATSALSERMPSATSVVIRFPGILPAPVVQCRRPGPLPKGIGSVTTAIKAHAMAKYFAAQRTRSPDELEQIIRNFTRQLDALAAQRLIIFNRREEVIGEHLKAVLS